MPDCLKGKLSADSFIDKEIRVIFNIYISKQNYSYLALKKHISIKSLNKKKVPCSIISINYFIKFLRVVKASLLFNN